MESHSPQLPLRQISSARAHQRPPFASSASAVESKTPALLRPLPDLRQGGPALAHCTRRSGLAPGPAPHRALGAGARTCAAGGRHTEPHEPLAVGAWPRRRTPARGARGCRLVALGAAASGTRGGEVLLIFPDSNGASTILERDFPRGSHRSFMGS